ncbi:MAG: glycosyltransferase family 4 protein [Actinobacteria bacterium]|nr:glycosyltransferase family 4 protein [Actinomycetota bacterium]
MSTSLSTRGGVSGCMRMLRSTPLWDTWDVVHIATHRDGSALTKILAFGRGVVAFLVALSTKRPDLVHLHMASYGSFARKATLAWTARIAGVPVVLHVHGGGFGVFYARAPRLLKQVIRTTLTRADAVVALGDRWAERLRAIAPEARVTVVPNAVRPCEVIRERAGDEAVHVVFLGKIGDGKGAFMLLEAWSRIMSDSQPSGTARLTLAGDGEVERARRTVARLGLETSAQVPGWLTPAQAHALIGSAHVLVLPSRNEGQPMAVLEAMASGVCVVASNVGGIPDLIESGTTGLLVPPGEVEALVAALQHVITDHEARARLGRAAHERVRAEFDTAVVWRRIDALYRKVLR